MNLLDMMYLDDLNEYNVKLYEEQVKTFFQETKSDFNKLFSLDNHPDHETFYQKTEAWLDLFKAIQAGFSESDECYSIHLGSEPLGYAAAALINFRKLYNYCFALPYIETRLGLAREIKKLKSELEKVEYNLEKTVPGLTRTEYEPAEMMKSRSYNELQKELRLAYLDPSTRGVPLSISFSGGKDSCLLAKAIFEMLENLPDYQRIRPVYIVYVNTHMEIPVVEQHIQDNLRQMREYAKDKQLPVEIRQLEADVSQRFWPLMVGLGYPPPLRITRWCSDRLKIKVTQKMINELASKHGKVIVVLGCREDESNARKQSIAKHSSDDLRYDERTNIKVLDGKRVEVKQLIYQPLRYFITETVWQSLEDGGLPWGDGYHRLKLFDGTS